MHHSNEIVSANAAVSASLGAAVLRSENVYAHGLYRVEVTTPIHARRDEYLDLLDQITRKNQLRAGLIGRAQRVTHGGQVRALYRQLNSIPTERKSIEEIENLVTNVGKAFLLDTVLAGSAYTAAWYLGLSTATTTPAAADTMASHSGWVENQNYTQGTRVAPSWSSATAGSKPTSSAAVFNINAASQVLDGVFLNSVSTKGGTTGTLYSIGTYTSKTLNSGDILNVSYTAGA